MRTFAQPRFFRALCPVLTAALLVAAARAAEPESTPRDTPDSGNPPAADESQATSASPGTDNADAVDPFLPAEELPVNPAQPGPKHATPPNPPPAQDSAATPPSPAPVADSATDLPANLRVTIVEGGTPVAIPASTPTPGAPPTVKTRTATPFPPKPLGPIPPDWRLNFDPNVPAEAFQVRLADGTLASLEITPPTLAPDPSKGSRAVLLPTSEDASIREFLTLSRQSLVRDRSRLLKLLAELDKVLPSPESP